MKRFFVLRAAPATGKSTWICDNGLEDITVSSDELRIAINGIVYDEEGNPSISQANPGLIWGRVKQEIERRMQEGEDIVLDSCALKTRDMNTYRELVERYGYDAYVVEFYHDVTVDICKERNRSREAFRYVPEYVIDNFFDKVGNFPVPDFYTVLYPEEAAEMLSFDEQA